jgi:hypothetical protein
LEFQLLTPQVAVVVLALAEQQVLVVLVVAVMEPRLAPVVLDCLILEVAAVAEVATSIK